MTANTSTLETESDILMRSRRKVVSSAGVMERQT